MARTDNFNNWATDVADSIREMTNKTDPIPASEFDTEIRSIQTGGGSDIEINNASYLFYNNARTNISRELLSMCKNLTNTYEMFFGASNIDYAIDLSKGQLDSLTNNQAYYYMFKSASKIPSVKLASTSNIPTTATYMFDGCSSLEHIDISKLNFENIYDVKYMFNSCSSLQTLNLPESMPKVTDIYSLFSYCKKIKNIKLPKFGTLKNASQAFKYCDSLESIDFGDNDLTSLTDISSMFGGDYQDTLDTTIEGTMELDLEALGFNFSKVTSKGYFLAGNKCIRKINLAPFDSLVFKTSELSNFFNGASSLVEIDLTPIHSNSTMNTLQKLFNNCVRLTKIIGLENLDTTGLTGTNGVYRMFYNCKALKEVNLSTLNTANITTYANSGYYHTSGFSSMFEKCESLDSLDISNFVINENVIALHYMFRDCKSLMSIKLPNFNTSSKITHATSMFENCGSLKTVDDWSKLPWATLTTMRNMFLNSGIESIDMTISSDVPTAKSIDTSYMFKNCIGLKRVNAKSIGKNTNSGAYMTRMFENCINLEEVDLSNYYNGSGNSSQASSMFYNCKSLKTVKLHNVDGECINGSGNYTYGVDYMFYGCESLEVLDLRYFCKGRTQMSYGAGMFSNCRKLRKLDLRGSDYGQLTSGGSTWDNGTRDTFLNCGVDNESPTIVYTSNASYQRNLITLGNKFGLGWSTENVIVVEDPEQEIDMT